jgi:hypothetical protein
MMNKAMLMLVGLLMAAFLLHGWSHAALEATEEQAYRIGVQAYVYGYPLVLMDLTRKVTARRVPMNQFRHAAAFPTAAFKAVVRSNVDTLYSDAWLDLSPEPVVLSVPDTGGRYYVIQMSDGWTETFALLGKRTTGTRADHFVVVGPDWQGSLPSNVEAIKAPTNMVWIVGRTQTNGVADYANVHAIQRGYRLAPLGAWGRWAPPAPRASVAPTVGSEAPPPVQVARMDAATFFTAFAALLKWNRPHPEDAPLVAELKIIGLEPGKAFDIAQLSPEAARGLDRAVEEARLQIARPGTAGVTTRNGWSMRGQNMGRYGTAYLDRARTARFGLGGLPPEEAVYFSTAMDDAGRRLSGTNRYVLHVGKVELPPVRAFWSVTLYDAEGYFWANPLNRYALRDRETLQYNPDGSLDVYIQHDAPSKDREANWLPSPLEAFNLTLRLYWPEPEVLSGGWMPAAVRRVP